MKTVEENRLNAPSHCYLYDGSDGVLNWLLLGTRRGPGIIFTVYNLYINRYLYGGVQQSDRKCFV